MIALAVAWLLATLLLVPECESDGVLWGLWGAGPVLLFMLLSSGMFSFHTFGWLSQSATIYPQFVNLLIMCVCGVCRTLADTNFFHSGIFLKVFIRHSFFFTFRTLIIMMMMMMMMMMTNILLHALYLHIWKTISD